MEKAHWSSLIPVVSSSNKTSPEALEALEAKDVSLVEGAPRIVAGKLLYVIAL